MKGEGEGLGGKIDKTKQEHPHRLTYRATQVAVEEEDYKLFRTLCNMSVHQASFSIHSVGFRFCLAISATLDTRGYASCGWLGFLSRFAAPACLLLREKLAA